MQKIVIASNNPHKVNEIKYFLKDLPIEIVSQNDFPNVLPAVEDGRNFTDNALKKAKHLYEQTGFSSLGDDSGLTVDVLNGEPGVISARYAGEYATDEENNNKLLFKLKDIPPEKRTASFKCILALISAENEVKTFAGECPGRIIFEPRGTKGFGYDPLFVPDGFSKTFAELDMTEKIKISHRGKALRELKEYLQQN
jgi:XTP/dITP diphosphohydrolase